MGSLQETPKAAINLEVREMISIQRKKHQDMGRVRRQAKNGYLIKLQFCSVLVLPMTGKKLGDCAEVDK